MLKEVAIQVDSLSKRYKLYHSQRDRIKELVHPFHKKYHHAHYALKNISLNIEKGEVFGIIGKNGSGKSTLLKILASVVSPTSGLYKCEGRVTALLELGGGFNKDLTGVDNIKFLGAIQGYTKKEIPNMVQRILDFADIGEYADQPVRTYSSGMYIRLAFSIAINIDPDILIIDEALAVGDIRFQQKCYRKIREFKDAGKTIVLCSHSLSTIKDFCSRAIWLHKGEIKEQGDPIFVTDCYNAFMTSNQDNKLQTNSTLVEKLESSTINQSNLPKLFQEFIWTNISNCESFGIGGCSIYSATIIHSETKKNILVLQGGEKISVMVQLTANIEVVNPRLQLLLNGPFGSSVFKISSHAYTHKMKLQVNSPTVVVIDFIFPRIGNGHYTFSLGILSMMEKKEQFHHWIHDALLIEVANQDIKYKMGTQMIVENVTFETYKQ